MDKIQKNPNSDNQSYEAAVASLNSTVTAKIFERGLSETRADMPALVQSQDGQVFSLGGYTGEKGPETVIDKLTGHTARFVIDANDIVWVSGTDIEPQKSSLETIVRLNGGLATAVPMAEAQRQEFLIAEPEHDRGYLPMGVLQAEAMPMPAGASDFTPEMSREISRNNNKGPLKRLGNAVTKAFINDK